VPEPLRMVIVPTGLKSSVTQVTQFGGGGIVPALNQILFRAPTPHSLGTRRIERPPARSLSQGKPGRDPFVFARGDRIAKFVTTVHVLESDYRGVMSRVTRQTPSP
jgi:hypothetical protein